MYYYFGLIIDMRSTAADPFNKVAVLIPLFSYPILLFSSSPILLFILLLFDSSSPLILLFSPSLILPPIFLLF